MFVVQTHDERIGTGSLVTSPSAGIGAGSLVSTSEGWCRRQRAGDDGGSLVSSLPAGVVAALDWATS
ncbi:hypothetical protein SAMN02745244_00190 [Tessaracoccus bendigoensis DSM 12906]|uniref:Uncharacterized protein n=1 Tax=Tessaracoccus bendigoensis DSM 12906 TaxID=1123357 RepID=A0A1M6AHD8_9ACTN|nr:hypothetical protein [Tessaracoccus bendigoensis]SHI35643.1 hypothetical protein SAMN02745244_00190 [Tessaracoccus bendigoensis DSM 12906]